MKHENHSKRLEQRERKDYFAIPEGYFDELPIKIMERLPVSRESKAWNQLWFWQLSGSLFLTAVLLIGYWLIPTQMPLNAESLLAEVPREAIIEYIQNQGIGTDEIMENISLEEVEFDEVYLLHDVGPFFDKKNIDRLLEQYQTTDELLQ
ncbi:hypothetical protein QWY31_05045 [Cytophagales bacterium LB-30]|uniref:Uncharacterized protein n=1 Tax=Shiella aurantiaca TaxID=3058365 RepID=A0ABT8F4F2_9BACT|nr:hypothetical protein [Shiella aurantiaca]MDN4164856.1 hypothetical protein [Shiella aurantiaca]